MQQRLEERSSSKVYSINESIFDLKALKRKLKLARQNSPLRAADASTVLRSHEKPVRDLNLSGCTEHIDKHSKPGSDGKRMQQNSILISNPVSPKVNRNGVEPVRRTLFEATLRNDKKEGREEQRKAEESNRKGKPLHRGIANYQKKLEMLTKKRV